PNVTARSVDAASQAVVLERDLRAWYIACEALRGADSASAATDAAPDPGAPIATALRASNWWRVAQQQLADARTALDEARRLAAAGCEAASAPALARAASAALVAALLLRLPYDAWRPDRALLCGWCEAAAPPPRLSDAAGECAALLCAVGV